MKSLKELAVIAVLASALGHTVGTAKEQPFSVVISTPTPEIKVGQPVEINVQLTNLSSHEINASSSWERGLDISYEYYIVSISGKKTNQVSQTGPPTGHTKMRSLSPGESIDESVRLSESYDMSHPGKYVIQLSRPIGETAKDGVVKSNRITVTVVPK